MARTDTCCCCCAGVTETCTFGSCTVGTASCCSAGVRGVTASGTFFCCCAGVRGTKGACWTFGGEDVSAGAAACCSVYADAHSACCCHSKHHDLSLCTCCVVLG
jgi:hypothetical protein